MTFVSENFGASKLAEKYGIKEYPAIFVDGVLIATPKDFGFFSEEKGSGRYTPWRDAENQARFKMDLTRMIDLILAGHKDLAEKQAAPADAVRELSTLPPFTLSDLSGSPVNSKSLAGRPVLVEFWATWCPPCRSTLQWLGQLKSKYGDNLAILAIAVDSPEEGVRSVAAGLDKDLRVAMVNATIAQSFGDITAVPTMFLFDKSGKTTKIVYGAPTDLHEQIGKMLTRLLN